MEKSQSTFNSFMMKATSWPACESLLLRCMSTSKTRSASRYLSRCSKNESPRFADNDRSGGVGDWHGDRFLACTVGGTGGLPLGTAEAGAGGCEPLRACVGTGVGRLGMPADSACFPTDRSPAKKRGDGVDDSTPCAEAARTRSSSISLSCSPRRLVTKCRCTSTDAKKFPASCACLYRTAYSARKPISLSRLSLYSGKARSDCRMLRLSPHSISEWARPSIFDLPSLALLTDDGDLCRCAMYSLRQSSKLARFFRLSSLPPMAWADWLKVTMVSTTSLGFVETDDVRQTSFVNTCMSMSCESRHSRTKRL
mmetsp:Transcript_11714/g.29604  ORF Transcript_11714/g.29604 Transcript_11714/m.29604 type:complete len:311 (-) Transcript_11714:126-1058(-)